MARLLGNHRRSMTQAWFDRTKALPAVAKVCCTERKRGKREKAQIAHDTALSSPQVLEGRSAIGSLGQYFMNDADYDRFNAA